jgi:hypothetical protein
LLIADYSNQNPSHSQKSPTTILKILKILIQTILLLNIHIKILPIPKNLQQQS